MDDKKHKTGELILDPSPVSESYWVMPEYLEFENIAKYLPIKKVIGRSSSPIGFGLFRIPKTQRDINAYLTDCYLDWLEQIDISLHLFCELVLRHLTRVHWLFIRDFDYTLDRQRDYKYYRKAINNWYNSEAQWEKLASQLEDNEHPMDIFKFLKDSLDKK